MKESKKAIIEILKKKSSKKNEKFENFVLNLALQKIDSDSFEYNDEGVYTADGKRIIYCMSQGESFSIQAGTVVIGEMAFRGKKHLKNVIIPDTVVSIERDAFYDCDDLETVYLPASVKEVRGCSFAECDKLKRVTFASVPEKMSRHTFDDCDQLREIFVPEGSASFFRKVLHYDESESEYFILEVKKEKKTATKKLADEKKAATKKLTDDQKVEEKKMEEKKVEKKKKAEKKNTNTKQND